MSRNRFSPHEQTCLSFRARHCNGSGQRPFSGVEVSREVIRVQSPYSKASLIHSVGIVSANNWWRRNLSEEFFEDDLTTRLLCSNESVTGCTCAKIILGLFRCNRSRGALASEIMDRAICLCGEDHRFSGCGSSNWKTKRIEIVGRRVIIDYEPHWSPDLMNVARHQQVFCSAAVIQTAFPSLQVPHSSYLDGWTSNGEKWGLSIDSNARKENRQCK